mgnify:CR=1 FL=1
MNFKRMIPMMMIASAPLAGMAQGKAGIIESNLDRSANPAEDFYQFATGGWQKANPLPAAYSRFGSFDQLQENNNKRINGILSELLKKNYSKGTVEQKLSDFYKLAMDSVRRNREGVAPVKPILDQMEAARTVADLQKVQGKYGVFGYGVPMGMGFGADEKNAKMNIFNIYQGGLTLGQREYYLDNDQTTADIRNAYKQFIVDMFKLFGFTEQQAQQKRDLIMRFETALALISKSQTELRDVEANYNKFTLKQFETDYPNIHLQQLCAAQGIQPQYIQEMIVGQPAFLAGLDKLLATQTADELRAYMEWDVINQAANYLSDDVRAVSFGFYSQTMRGAKEDQPRWKRATSQVEGMMGEALGRIYCEKYFPASSKKRMEELIGNLQVALTERIKAQTWMSEPTKKNALDKLAAFYVKVGYPNTWKDLSALTIDPQKSYYENMLSCVTFWSNEAIEKKAGKPVDRDEWHMTPQTVNAYYNPTTNEICFPAAILQPPFYNPDADDAVNYGAIGVVIGHEMTHGFDDQGRNFDKDGNMNNWWTDADAAAFKAKTEILVKQFDAIEVLPAKGDQPAVFANGALCLGENIADQGGLRVARTAYRNSLEGKEEPAPIDGFTPEQRFYLGYATLWAQNIRDEEIARLTKLDVHSLGKWRVNATLRNLQDFYDTFSITDGAMFMPEEERVIIW